MILPSVVLMDLFFQSVSKDLKLKLVVEPELVSKFDFLRFRIRFKLYFASISDCLFFTP